jgi:hypothetical protein
MLGTSLAGTNSFEFISDPSTDFSNTLFDSGRNHGEPLWLTFEADCNRGFARELDAIGCWNKNLHTISQ